MFPTPAAAEAFIADLQAQGVATLSDRTATVTRQTTQVAEHPNPVVENEAEGAVKGTGVGALVGVAAGVLATAATVATGGLVLPIILGMAAAGAGVGAVVGSLGADLHPHHHAYEVESTRYDTLDQGVTAGGRAVGVDDSVPEAVLTPTLARHGGTMV